MSNLTDGKTALAAGKFTTAENKLNRALDAHPDNGEIWWALMLCRAECKNDAELKTKLVASFTDAAKSGAPQPATPLDTPYGKNALRYAKGESGQKRREYVNALVAELDEIWQAERGGKLKIREVKAARTRRKNFSASAAIVYALLSLCFVLGGLSAYGAFAGLAWLLWTGLGVFVAFEAIAVWIIYRAGRAEKKIPAAVPLAITAGVVFGIAVFATAFAANNRAALIAAAIIICIAAAVAAFVLMPAKKNGGRKSAAAEVKDKKAESEKAGTKTNRVKKRDDYIDTDD